MLKTRTADIASLVKLKVVHEDSLNLVIAPQYSSGTLWEDITPDSS